jgi:hypothetical protein
VGSGSDLFVILLFVDDNTEKCEQCVQQLDLDQHCILVLFYQPKLRPGTARNHVCLAQPSMLHVITSGRTHSSDWGLNQDVGK